jgi:phosphatidylserine decarboxylase
MGITGAAGPILVRRTAGLVARRIVTWTRRDERVAAGQKLGMLKFGSRTDVLIPEGVADVLVKEGDYVRAGCSILARYR